MYYELLQFQIKLSIFINTATSINSFNSYNVSNEFERERSINEIWQIFQLYFAKKIKKYHLFFWLENSPACVNPPLTLWSGFIWLFTEIVSILFDSYAFLNIGKNAKNIN